MNNKQNLQLQEQLNRLTDLITKYNIAYYVHNTPLVSDAEYDDVLKEINVLITKYPFLQNNISNAVGSSLDNNSILKQKKHSVPMLSLDNLFSYNDAIEFDKKIKKFLNLDLNSSMQYSVEPKVDGLSLSLIYNKGKLVTALSRGDGEVGEDLTQNAKTIATIPLHLSGNYPDILEVRGEVYMDNKDFLLLNQQQEQTGKKIFANPRNAAAGSMRNLDYNLTKTRPLKFIAWGFGKIIQASSNSFYNNLQQLNTFGFVVNKYNKVLDNIEDVYKYYTYLQEIRHTIEYDIDGVVYKVNSVVLQNRLGNTNKGPRWAAAHKFASYTAISKVKDITFQVGRTGIITPVAELEPINIGGVLVARASLHNMDEIERKDIRINDVVLVKRAGDIIPQIVEVDVNKRSHNVLKVAIPLICPSCGSKTININSKVALSCSASTFYCQAQLLSYLEYFVSKFAFNIDGIGKKQLLLFYNLGFIKEPADIFDLHKYKNQLLSLDGFGDILVNKLLLAIENSKKINLVNFIYSLGIKQVGEGISKLLASNFITLNNFMNTFSNASNISNININGIGSSILNDLFNYFAEDNNKKMVNNLITKIIVNDYINLTTNNSLQSKTFMFTGTLNTLSRSEAKFLVEKNGGNVLSSLNKTLNYLVVGSKAGSKLTKANELNITILTEEQFINLINTI